MLLMNSQKKCKDPNILGRGKQILGLVKSTQMNSPRRNMDKPDSPAPVQTKSTKRIPRGIINAREQRQSKRFSGDEEVVILKNQEKTSTIIPVTPFLRSVLLRSTTVETTEDADMDPIVLRRRNREDRKKLRSVSPQSLSLKATSLPSIIQSDETSPKVGRQASLREEERREREEKRLALEKEREEEQKKWEEERERRRIEREEQRKKKEEEEKQQDEARKKTT
eukprot:TRINITY_DN5857_c0_g1_i1.p1 TRINITY_DN5857_c0_g1~~TRINITY_DN5857_c0_g1_i1.p1  ORF type:complete len:224 (-),score=65.95 TRINITY_DN5857_c0_g1_i1:4-675(-)